MTDLVLVLNVGSSSVRYALIAPGTGKMVAGGHVRDIGGAGPPDHNSAIQKALDELASRPGGSGHPPVAVGHRVVHGGPRFHAPVVVDDTVLSEIEALEALAPLHNPGSLAGIAAARRAFPRVPQVAVFDTAFHHTIPEHASTYAVPRRWREEYGVRRYGFHGISYAHASRRTARLLGIPLIEANLVLLHLGNGASACAVRAGMSIDVSMGLTPVEGLVMGTRSGDVDPSLAPYLARVAGVNVEEYETALNEDSGLLALAGTSDMKEVERHRAAGDARAALAFDVVAYRLRKYIGAYAVALGRADGIAFTGGIGEHSAALRAAVVGDLRILGVELDATANNRHSPSERRITTAESRVPVYVVPANEELEIASACIELLGGPPDATQAGTPPTMAQDPSRSANKVA